MAALMEAYGAVAPGLEATLEILSNENSPPLATDADAHRRRGRRRKSRPPARNSIPRRCRPDGISRAARLRQGGKAQGHMIRPFRSRRRGAAIDGRRAGRSASMPKRDGDGDARRGGEVRSQGAAHAGDAGHRCSRWPTRAPAGSKAAIKEARGGDLGAAAMTALGEERPGARHIPEGPRAVPGGAARSGAAMQFQSSMQMAPTFAPSRLILGASLAEANRHREAAGLLQSALTTPPNAAIARIAGEEWIKAGQPALAIPPLELAVVHPNADGGRFEEDAGNRLRARRPGARSRYGIDRRTSRPTRRTAPLFLAGIFGTYSRHLGGSAGRVAGYQSRQCRDVDKATLNQGPDAAAGRGLGEACAGAEMRAHRRWS